MKARILLLSAVYSGCGLVSGSLILGCEPSITAVNLNDPKAPEGIPYYLPKPYLVIAKNVRYIPTPTVGLTQTAPIPNSFDSSSTSGKSGGGKGTQGSTSGGSGGGGSGGGGSGGGGSGGGGSGGGGSGGGGGGQGGAAKSATAKGGAAKGGAGTSSGGTSTDGTTGGGQDGGGQGGGNASANNQVFGPSNIAVVPAASIPDGLTPDTFYTYQVLYLPDLTQKYGLRVKGGAGEMRATANLVNGWMHTGPGPIYFRDSFTADQVSAYGSAASGILESAAQFATSIMGVPTAPTTPNPTPKGPKAQGESQAPVFRNFAEVWVYEPVLVPDKTVIGGQRTDWRLLPGFPRKFDREYAELTALLGSGGGGGGGGDTKTADPFPAVTKEANAQIDAAHITADDGTAVKAVKTIRQPDTTYEVFTDKRLKPDDIATLKSKITGYTVSVIDKLPAGS
jgi:hypothetical protein